MSKQADATRQKARNLIQTLALKDLGALLLATALGGAALRGGVGLAGQLRQGWQQRKRRYEDQRVFVPLLPKSAEKQIDRIDQLWNPGIPRPDWFVPATVLGTPLALYLAWTGTGRALKSWRKRRDQHELDKAKREFEDSLRQQRGAKTAAQLDELAAAYVRGDLDGALEKAAALDAVTGTVAATKPIYYTMAALLAGLGVLGGWNIMGRGSEAEQVEAYREALRRRRIARPPSLVARVSPDATDTEEEEPEKTAAARVLGQIGTHLGTGMAGGLLGSYFMTKLPVGRSWLASRSQDLMKDPVFVRRQMQNVLSNPELRRALYKQLLPTLLRDLLPGLSRGVAAA